MPWLPPVTMATFWASPVSKPGMSISLLASGVPPCEGLRKGGGTGRLRRRQRLFSPAASAVALHGTVCVLGSVRWHASKSFGRAGEKHAAVYYDVYRPV